MIQYKLEKEDRIFFKSEITQFVLMGLSLLLVFSVVALGFIFILEKAIPNLNSVLAYSLLALVYLGFLIYKLRPMVIELHKGIKGITEGIITDKKESVKYAWSGSVGADLTTRTKLIEYFFTIDNQDIWVEEKYYHQFNIDDKVSIHFSLRTGKVIRVSKEEEIGACM